MQPTQQDPATALVAVHRHLAQLAPVRSESIDATKLSLPALMYWGEQLAAAGFPKGAADVFRYVLLVAPTHLLAWHALANCHLDLDDFETAARLFELASELGQRAAFLQLAARAWFAAGDPERGTCALHAVWEPAQ